MDQEKKRRGRLELSRRDFLKVSAAGAAAATAIDWAPAPAMAQVQLTGNDTAIVTHNTTCTYCSAQCGQKVSVGNVTGKVYDIYGDWESPTSNGGLCSKGAGAYQLVNNKRRLGVDGWNHGDTSGTKDMTFAEWSYPDATKGRSSFNYVAETGDYATGVAYKRIGNGDWQRMGLDAAMAEIAGGDRGTGQDDTHDGLVAIRGTVTPGTTSASNATAVQFFGSSHLNNEQNYLYRKIIANFGTSRVEHQARI